MTTVTANARSIALESIGIWYISIAKRNAGVHHRLFLFVHRTAAPGAADDDPSGRVQALQVHAVIGKRTSRDPEGILQGKR